MRSPYAAWYIRKAAIIARHSFSSADVSPSLAFAHRAKEPNRSRKRSRVVAGRDVLERQGLGAVERDNGTILGIERKAKALTQDIV